MMKRRAVSTGGAIGALIVGLLIGAGAVAGFAPSLGLGGVSTVTTGGGGTTTKTVTTTSVSGGNSLCNGGNVKIGVLTELTGSLQAQGIGTKTAVEMAVADINTWLHDGGCNLTFSAVTQDYAGSATTALAKIGELDAAGVTVVVGPLRSDAIVGIYSYIQSHHIVDISPSSTAASLSINDDYLFRTVPTDLYQGQADAREMTERGVNCAIVVHAIGTYSGGLANATATWFETQGGHVIERIPYDSNQADFSAVLSKINTDWNTALAQANCNGADHIAIYAVSFEEFGQILVQANNQYPALLNSTQPWFGSDGQSQDTVLTNSTYGALMAQIRLPSTIYNAPGNLKGDNFSARFLAQTGQGATIYQTGSYDDAWLAALSVMAAGTSDGAAVQSVLRGVAGNYYGVTGWTILGPSGDALPLFGYQIWKVVMVNGSATWVRAGTWDVSTDVVTWTSPP
ncbi:MAG: ABC transporter substrate-binding protein [Thaumarchaeota archaeon]|nr:ABC transporter substrate-binding protein [Nitrososphaerota archaeon]